MLFGMVFDQIHYTWIVWSWTGNQYPKTFIICYAYCTVRSGEVVDIYNVLCLLYCSGEVVAYVVVIFVIGRVPLFKS